MDVYPEQLFVAALRECNPTEASLYEAGLVDRTWLLRGQPSNEESGHLAFGIADAAVWMGPIIGTTLVWLFGIGQEALRERLKLAAADFLKTKKKGNGAIPTSLEEVRAKFDEECKKRGVDEQAALRCGDAFVSILVTHGTLLEMRKAP